MRNVLKIVSEKAFIRSIYYSPDWCGSVGWASSSKVERSLIQFPVRVHARGNQFMFLSHINVSLPLLLPNFSSFPKKKVCITYEHHYIIKIQHKHILCVFNTI